MPAKLPRSRVLGWTVVAVSIMAHRIGFRCWAARREIGFRWGTGPGGATGDDPPSARRESEVFRSAGYLFSRLRRARAQISGSEFWSEPENSTLARRSNCDPKSVDPRCCQFPGQGCPIMVRIRRKLPSLMQLLSNAAIRQIFVQCRRTLSEFGWSIDLLRWVCKESFRIGRSPRHVDHLSESPKFGRLRPFSPTLCGSPADIAPRSEIDHCWLKSTASGANDIGHTLPGTGTFGPISIQSRSTLTKLDQLSLATGQVLVRPNLAWVRRLCRGIDSS